ncbi:MAG: hypothetical protein MMC23_001377 [Stictis urceolatum]|nr:hypothetical protein [Stictis urceolata]
MASSSFGGDVSTQAHYGSRTEASPYSNMSARGPPSYRPSHHEIQAQKLRAEQEIREKLKKHMKRANEPSKAFICKEDLRTEVKPYLWRLFVGEPSTEQQIADICDQSLKIVSLLVWVKAAASVSSLHDVIFKSDVHGDGSPLTDQILPLDGNDLLGYLSISKSRELLSEQWRFIPVEIQEQPSQKSKWVYKEQRLPWIEETDDCWRGGFGDVKKVTIPPGYYLTHDGDSNPEPKVVACKLIKGKNAEHIFQTEVNNLSVLKESIRSHQNIVRHTATFIQENNYWILFPLAAGDLGLFLNEGMEHDTSPSDLDPSLFSMLANVTKGSLISQCYRLADALWYLHTGIILADSPAQVYCIHMDLKPENVLIMSATDHPVGQWQLSDFGLSVIDTQTSCQDTRYLTIGEAAKFLESNVRPQRKPGTYQAPEVEPSTANKVGRKTDVWSMACIFSEVLAFALGGRELLLEFRSARLFENESGDKDDYFYSETSRVYNKSQRTNQPFVVRPQVVYWLNQLPDRYPEEADWIFCCVNIILKALVVDYDARPDSKMFAEDLLHARNHWESPETYSGPNCTTVQVQYFFRTTPPNSSSAAHLNTNAAPWRPHQAQRNESAVFPWTPSEVLTDSRSEIPRIQSRTQSLPNGINPKTSPQRSRKSLPASMVSMDRPASKASSLSLHHLVAKSNSEVHNLSPPKHSSKWTMVALSLQGDRAAWITEREIHFYSIDYEAVAKEMSVVETSDRVEWKTAIIAGDFVALSTAGAPSSATLAVRIYSSRRTQLANNHINVPESYWSRTTLRTALVSSQGRVFLVHDDRISILRIVNPAEGIIAFEEDLLPSEPKEKIRSATLSSSGQSVFAWTWLGGPERFHAWELSSESGRWEKVGQMAYKTLHTGRWEYNMTPLPYHSIPGCIMMREEEFFSAHLNDEAIDDNTAQRTKTEVRDVVLASVVSDDCMMTVEKKKGFSTGKRQLKRYGIFAEGAKRTIRRQASLICDLKTKIEGGTSRMQVLCDDDDEKAVVVICNNNSKGRTIEIVQLYPPNPH